MLAKLKFKTDLFDGVLNGGEDEVFLDNNKLETLVNDLGFGEEAGATEPESTFETFEPVEKLEETPSAEELINQGVAFLGGLMQTLKQPESARRLVDALVKEDPATGQASINIPVPGKESVLQFISLLGKLL